MFKIRKKILICGNGGSEAEANHLAAEFIVRLKPSNNRKAIPIISLSQNTSVLTACGNDLGFENIFLDHWKHLQIKEMYCYLYLLQEESLNVIKALKLAKEKKIKTISFLGHNGGKAKSLSDLKIVIPSEDVARVQECHLFLGHHIFSEVEKSVKNI